MTDFNNAWWKPEIKLFPENFNNYFRECINGNIKNKIMLCSINNPLNDTVNYYDSRILHQKNQNNFLPDINLIDG